MQQQYDNDARLDRMLDAAIASYADPAEAPHPRQFAAKIMAAAQESAPRRSRWLWPLAIGIPALAAFMLAAFILLRAPAPPRIANAPRTPEVAGPLALSRIPPLSTALRIKRMRKPAASARKIPKFDQFPAPQPLSEQERLLLAFAEHAPASAKEAVIASQKQIAEPLHVPSIEIPSLNTAPLAQNDEPVLPAAYPFSASPLASASPLDATPSQITLQP